MRREPLEVRKSALAGVLRRMKAWAGIQLNEHCDDLPVDVVFRHACKLGFEGIVSARPKRIGGRYSPVKLVSPSGRTKKGGEPWRTGRPGRNDIGSVRKTV
jgi:hypothetical protein